MRFCIVLNKSAGTLARAPERDWPSVVADGFRQAGHEVECRMVAPADLTAALREAAARPVDGVLVGGGDGTLATAGSILADTGRALGVLPLGTMNLLARDMGIPLVLEDAVAALAQGEIRPMDVGEVNGRVFLCHAVIGLYPRMVRERERQRRLLGIGKKPAMAWAILSMLPRSPMLDVTLALEGRTVAVQAAALAVSNNPMEPLLERPLARPRLDTGELGVYVAKHRGVLKRLRLMARLALGSWQEDNEMEAFGARELTVASRRGRPVTVALDGDLHRMLQPLHFTIRPRALAVLWPRLPGEAARPAELADVS